jgi:ribosomal protein S18 acetylase RimI-like enzyme
MHIMSCGQKSNRKKSPMIKRIDSTNYELLSGLMDRYRRARNRDVDIYLSPEWVDLILEGFRSNRFYGLCYLKDDSCRGFLEYKLGKKSAYSSMIYAINSADRKKTLTDLVRALIESSPRRNIMISEVAPGIAADFQAPIYKAHGFEQIRRPKLELNVQNMDPMVKRPRGIVFRKYNRNMDSLIVKLDERAYRNHPDEIILKILTDIGRCAPSLRIVHSNRAIFESRLSYFAFAGKDLAGAIYCTRKGPELGIANIATDPEYRGRGIGKALISKALRGMSAYGYRKCTLTVSEGNLPARNLYKKFGFKLKRICPIFVYRTGQGV